MRLAVVWNVVIIAGLLVGIGNDCCAPLPTQLMSHHCSQCLSASDQVATSTPVSPRHIVLVEHYISIEKVLPHNQSCKAAVILAENTGPSESLQTSALRI